MLLRTRIALSKICITKKITKKEKISIDVSLTNIDNLIFTTFARNTSSIAINISEEFQIKKRKSYILLILLIYKKRSLSIAFIYLL